MAKKKTTSKTEKAPTEKNTAGKKATKDKKRKGKKSAAKAKSSKKKERKPTRKKSEADRGDRHKLYQQSVQTPQADVDFFDEVFRKTRGRKPISLREDFCGTAFLSATWVKSDDERTAVGIDLDPEPIAWGREKNLGKLSEAQAERVTLVQADVLEGSGPSAEIVCAMNFSYCVFKRRSELAEYLKVVYDRLAEDGMFFTELYGGTEAVIELEEPRDCGDFTYVWEQESFNPLTHETRCHIHYKFEDGSKMMRAFSYDWRLWTVPEMRELLEEVGFSSVKVYWETVDDEGVGTGEFEPTEVEENQESWLVYIVAAK